MMRLSRRAILGGVVAVPVLTGPLARLISPVAVSVMTYDPTLPEGRRYAARARQLGHRAVLFQGDPIRRAMALLESRPAAIWGMTRFSQALLMEDAAREAGYKALAVIQHCRSGAFDVRCRPEVRTFGALAQLAGCAWPERFAELAAGGLARPALVPAKPVGDATSWVMVRQN